ncbi:Cyclin-D5-3 [Dichanthelium oligosanthes]|uniref:Cyclin-D5-3 n=1 Tax=Dichanthelium oligosanthes TaxID=888268 RepID=A0A1E5UJK1_9POAL|nr:Cyclin-D5-3 [Dichanthelium oligosanthes]
MGDAAAAAASTSAPATPTSILICREDGNDLFPDADDGAGADFVVARDDRLLVVDQDDEYVAVLLSKEGASGCGGGGTLAEEMEEWMKAARSGCVRWIIKTTAMFRFSGKTAYVAVTYLDRFLAQRRVNRGQEWALQLLAVACLSLASKVEERHAPRLSELRLDAYEFDSASILRMELLVLGTLQWQMIAATPFPYISCFAARFRQDERRAIVLRAVECIFAAIKAMSSVEYQPSTVAVASILAARGNEETPAAILDELKAILGSSWPQLDTGHVYSCYSAMIQEDGSSVHSAEVASSGVSVAAHVGSPDASLGTNNAAGTTAPPATPDNNNKRRRLRSPQRQ